MSLATGVRRLHRAVFGAVQAGLEDWFLGLAARFVFASVLLLFYLNSAMTKFGSGFPEALVPTANAYFQIVPQVMERVGYDVSQIAFFPYGLLVWVGSYCEVILPVLIVIGLFTRLASLGMIVFTAVQTYVDIVFLHVDAKTVGTLFDRLPDAAIADQRLLWIFLLVYLVLRGPGAISLDWLLGRGAVGGER